MSSQHTPPRRVASSRRPARYTDPAQPAKSVRPADTLSEGEAPQSRSSRPSPSSRPFSSARPAPSSELAERVSTTDATPSPSTEEPARPGASRPSLARRGHQHGSRSQHRAAKPAKSKRKVSARAPELPELEEACRALRCDVPSEALPPLMTYLELLMRWNKVMNLVGSRHWRECFDNLLVDSFHLAGFIRSLPIPQGSHAWDLGAGAGVPGIPLRMIWQEGHYHMVEVREKRALFLSTVLAALNLPRTTAFRGRAEEFFVEAPCAAHVVVSRAFMPWRDVLLLVKDHVVPQGRVIFLSLEPAPAILPADVAPHWHVEAQSSYKVGADKRWFWSLQSRAAVLE